MNLIALHRRARVLKWEAQRAAEYAEALPRDTLPEMWAKSDAHGEAARLHGEAAAAYGEISDACFRVGLILYAISGLFGLFAALA